MAGVELFRAQPRLEIPDNNPKVPKLDFAPLAKIGDTVVEGQRRQAITEAIGRATGPDGKLDFDSAGAELAKIPGALEEARPFLALAQQKAALAQSGGQHAATLAESSRHNQASEALQERQLAQAEARQPWAAGPDNTLTPKVGGSADPAYQARLRDAQDKTIESQVNERQKAVVSRGLDPNEPGNRAYILTGKMPREDQVFSATDKKAILEADEHVQTNLGAIDSLNRAKELSTKAMGGPLAGERGYVSSLFGSESGKATTGLTTEITQNSVAQLKAIFGGNPTEGERKILLDIQGSVNQPDSVRQEIYSRAIQLAERRLQFNKQRADELRGGTFYKPPKPAGPAGASAPASTAPAAQPGAVAPGLPPLPSGFQLVR